MLTFNNYQEPVYTINKEKGMIIGKTEPMLDLFHYLNHLTDSPATVLLRGETGTGKELCAKALHYNGNRGSKNFVAVNCAGIPSELLESELFGSMKGAFTGAYRDSTGKFQYANKGTIFLDEIGEMSMPLQAKLLRVLQERQVTKVGSNQPEEVDIRVITATHKDLEQEVKKGSFRRDLYYRLNVVPLAVPSLKDRTEDIPLIAQYVAKKYNEKYDAKIQDFSSDALDKLQGWPWKGNIRELENTIERVFVLRREGIIQADNLYFNSEMPKRIFIPERTPKAIDSPQGREAIKLVDSQSGTLEQKTRLWFEEGVLPVSVLSLTRMSGIKNSTAIYEKTNKGDIYTQRFISGEKHSHPIVYLTPQNASSFFSDIDNPDYQQLLQKVKEGEFNQIVHTPFNFFSISDFVDEGDSWEAKNATKKAIKDAVEGSALYTISFGQVFCFALTADKVSSIIPPAADKEEQVQRWQTKINSAYKQFRNWKVD